MGVRDLLVAGLLLASTAVIYHRAPVSQMYDSLYLTAVSHSLIHEGDLSVPVHLYHPGTYQFWVVGSELYHYYPNAPAVLNVPLVWAFERMGVPVYSADGAFLLANEERILRASAALVTALSVAVAYLLARIYLGVPWSLSLAVVFAFGTQLFSTASRAYWSHSWGVLLLFVALYLVLAPNLRRRPWAYVAAATSLSWAFFCRPPFALAAVAVTLLALARERRRFVPWLVGTGAAWLILFCMHSRSVWGQLLPPIFGGHHLSLLLGGEFSLGRLAATNSTAAWGTLISPGRGLFVYSPIFVLILWLAARHWRHLPSRLLAILALGVIVSHWKLMSSFHDWIGGASFGARFFTDVVPWFFVLAVLAVAAASHAAAERKRTIGGLRVGLWAAVALISVFINARGAMSWATRGWGEWEVTWAPPALQALLSYELRLWNWRYPQFLAGLVPAPTVENFDSWDCGGRERLRQRCGRRLVVKLAGDPGSGYVLRLSDDRVREGHLDANGKAKQKFRSPPPGGAVTVLWDCGTVITESYACP